MEGKADLPALRTSLGKISDAINAVKLQPVDDEENEACLCCLEKKTPPDLFTCGHKFCKECISKQKSRWEHDNILPKCLLQSCFHILLKADVKGLDGNPRLPSTVYRMA